MPERTYVYAFVNQNTHNVRTVEGNALHILAKLALTTSQDVFNSFAEDEPDPGEWTDMPYGIVFCSGYDTGTGYNIKPVQDWIDELREEFKTAEGIGDADNGDWKYHISLKLNAIFKTLELLGITGAY